MHHLEWYCYQDLEERHRYFLGYVRSAEIKAKDLDGLFISLLPLYAKGGDVDGEMIADGGAQVQKMFLEHLHGDYGGWSPQLTGIKTRRLCSRSSTGSSLPDPCSEGLWKLHREESFCEVCSSRTN